MSSNQDLENFILDMTTLARTPSAVSFITTPEFRDKFLEEFKGGHPTIKNIDVYTVPMNELDDMHTINFSFVASGYNGMSMDPLKFVTRLINAFMGEFSEKWWGPIYNRSKNSEIKVNIPKVLLRIGGFSLSRNTDIVLKNDMSIQDIVGNEYLYKAFIKYIEDNEMYRWYAGSNSRLEMITIKKYDGQYLLNQSQALFRAENPVMFDHNVIEDEWIDNVKFEKQIPREQSVEITNSNISKVFFGRTSILTKIVLSNSMLIERDTVYVSHNLIKGRAMDETQPTIDENGIKYLPAIRYSVTMKLFIDHNFYPENKRDWLIFNV